MDDKQIWLLAYHGILSTGMEPVLASYEADKALKEYKHRFGDD